MADLDDFFAKKDRKKSKSVKKFATAEELAKKMEDTKKPDVRPKKERPVQEGEEQDRGGEEEEWKEYEEPVKDYTGLKIQVLQGGNGAPDSGRDSSTEDSMPENSKNKGPWNKPTEVEQAPQPTPQVEEKPQQKKTTAYVPPQSRNKPNESSHRPTNRNAIDIHNEDYFPVLGAGAKRGGGWSTAAGAGSSRPASSAQPLTLGNRYTSLQHDT
ncbi:protein CDV3 homolog [Leptidea sinapis]|uniref:protein CDV3 homolog n=1 Tax=Leptidea sinapis TaxID=189913 RepID=UPI0021366295|nr:protein CDV3 homolog [Leptidea sinapis]